MAQKKRNSILTVDVTIHYRGSVYAFSLSKLLKWFAVLVLVAERVYRHLHGLAA